MDVSLLPITLNIKVHQHTLDHNNLMTMTNVRPL